MHILTLSAKSPMALKNLKDDYVKYLQNKKEVNPADMCYTANTGREHYGYRLAVIGKSMEQIIAGLEALGYSTGEVKSEARELNNLAAQKLSEFLASDRKSLKTLEELGKLYQQGADIRWEELYRYEKVKKVSIPSYHFEEKRSWLDIPEISSRSYVRHDSSSSVREESKAAKVILKGNGEDGYAETEELIAQIWGKTLGFQEIDIKDNFYELGGDSILAGKIANNINKDMGIKLEVADILQYQTIAELALCIDERQNAQDGDKDMYPEIAVAEKKEFYPVSAIQKSMFIQEQFEGIGTSYNMPIQMLIEGILDRDRFEQAFSTLIKRHESLRTTFEFIEGEPVLRIHENVDFKIDYEEGSEEKLKTAIGSFVRTFDLGKAPLLRVKLVKLDADKHLFILDMHHIISDGVSINILMKEFGSLYEGLELPELKIQYKDFALWQDQLLSSELIRKQEGYWQEKLSGEIPILNMPLDYKRPEKRTFDGNTLRFTIPIEITEKMNALAKKYSTTMNTLMFAFYTLLLHKYTAQEDIVIGSLVAGRNSAELENIIGVFINYLPIRNTVKPTSTFEEYLREVKSVVLNAYGNQDYPFDHMVEKLAKGTDRSRNALFDTMLIFHNQVEVGMNMEIGEMKFTRHDMDTDTSKLDFKMDVYMSDSHELSYALEYNTKLFREETIRRMSEHFENIIRQAAENPVIQLCRVEILSEREKYQVLEEFNATKADYPREKTLHSVFEEQVENKPQSTAIIFEGKALSYRELNSKVNQLARMLREKGVGRDSIVGLMIERSLEMEIGILAILKAGGAYLPISPDYPEDRIKYMLEDSGAAVLLTQGKFMDRVDFVGTKINLEDRNIYQGEDSNPEYISTSRDLAYIIYTSGSTGKPKGVMIEHYSAINRINWMQKKYPINSDDVILQKTPFTFDVSVWELFWWFFTGAKVCFLLPGGEKDPEAIIAAIEKNKATTMHFVPSMLNAFLDYIDGTIELQRLSSLKQIFASGEALNPHQVENFNRLLWSTNGTILANLYGPTEATVDVSYFDCSTGEKLEVVPIGKPIDNIELYVVDKYNNLMPIGVAGELCIAGDGLARGYLGRPELTAEKFTQNPFREGQKMYRTGDLTRWLPDGNIEYLGRIDHQVKIRGFRIELGEIEAELLKNTSIKEAIVIDRKDERGAKYLCAYLVAEKLVPAAELREQLLRSLPEYMVPSYFVAMEKMPLSSNGKIDRKALPEPEISASTKHEYEAPRNEVEQKLAEIWQEILEIDKIGINDSFFEVGGNSLKIIAIASKIHKELNVQLSLTEVLNTPTIKALGESIQKVAANIYSSIQPVEEREHYPLSLVQRKIFAEQQLNPESTAFNMTGMLQIEGAIIEPVLEETIEELLYRHDALRTYFELIDGEPVQIVDDYVDFEIEYIDGEGRAIEDILEEFAVSFELDMAPLFRVQLVKLSENNNILMFDMHKIIADELSLEIFKKEFIDMYQGYKLNKIKLHYKDYSVWQNEGAARDIIKNQEKYWLEKFAGEIPSLRLPAACETADHASTEANVVSLPLEQLLSDQLKELAREEKTTIYMLMLSAYNVLLSKYSGQNDIIVGTPIPGRPHKNLEVIIGPFANMLPMRNFPDGNRSFRQLSREVKENSFRAYENQDYPLGELLGRLGIDSGIKDLFRATFDMRNGEAVEISENGVTFRSCERANNKAIYDLNLQVLEQDGNIAITLKYSTAMFTEAAMVKMAKHLVNIIDAAANYPDMKLSDIDIEADRREQAVQQNYASLTSKAAAESAQYSDNMVLIRKGSRYKDNIFLIHDGSGDIGGYVQLCSSMKSDFNYWGIKADLKSSIPQNISIKNIAEKYINAIKSIQPIGPYFITGWSIGGTIAYEMVRQLEEMGDSIGKLVLIDCYIGKGDMVYEDIVLEMSSDEFTPDTEKEYIEKLFAGKCGSEELMKMTQLEQIWHWAIQQVENGSIGIEEVKSMAPENMAYIIPDFDRIDIRRLVIYMNMMRTLDVSRNKYEPIGKIKSVVHFLSASESKHIDPKKWNPYCEEPVRITEITGNHLTVMSMPNVIEHANRLDEIIEK